MFDNEADDTCRDQRKALQSYGNYFEQNMLVGAGAGALTATAVAVATHQSVKATIVEAFAGLMIGAAAGYWESVQQKASNTQARYRLVQDDIQGENAKVDGVQHAFNTLIDCRRKQAAKLRADVAAGRVSHDDGTKQMNQIKARYDDDIAIARRIDSNIADHTANLEYASEQFKPQPYVVLRPTIVYADKSSGSAKLTSYRENAVISAAAIDSSWVKVTLSGKRTGYVQAADVKLQAATLVANKKSRQAPPASAKGDPVAEGVFTNLSKRADFDDSVQVASSNTSGFELSGG